MMLNSEKKKKFVFYRKLHINLFFEKKTNFNHAIITVIEYMQ